METIPSSVEDISSEWLNQVFSKSDIEDSVVGVELVEANSGTTGRAKFHLRWKANRSPDLPKSIFVKLVPDDPLQQRMNEAMGMGKREAQFYKLLAHEIPVIIPTNYYSAWSDDATSYIMIMGDLAEAGGRPTVLGPDSHYTVAEKLIDALAVLHAKYWDSERFQSDLSWVQPYAPIRNAEPPMLVDRCCRLFRDLMPPVFVEARNLFVERQVEVADLFEVGIPTLVHGDCHLSNLFLDQNEGLGFLDWAIVSRMPAMWDIAYGLGISFPPEVRRKAEENLLPRYVQVFEEASGIKLDWDTFWYRYRLTSFYAWISAVATLGGGERMQPLEWGLNTIQWTTQLIEEHDAVSLIKRELEAK